MNQWPPYLKPDPLCFSLLSPMVHSPWTLTGRRKGDFCPRLTCIFVFTQGKQTGSVTLRGTALVGSHLSINVPSLGNFLVGMGISQFGPVMGYIISAHHLYT